jgi:hypothetical protein
MKVFKFASDLTVGYDLHSAKQHKACSGSKLSHLHSFIWNITVLQTKNFAQALLIVTVGSNY